jgi:two-component system sensor histidine kinase UhpB
MLKDKPLSILIVEDNPGDFIILSTYLEQLNIKIEKIHHAETIKDLSAFTREKIDLAFLDLSLPDSSGTESFFILNQMLPWLPIIVLSGMADKAIALKCIEMGAQDYLLKNDLEEKWLEKSIQYSIERKKNLEEIKKINAQYELVGELTDDIILTWNLNTHVVTANKKSFLGYTGDDIETTLGWWTDRIHAEDREHIFALIKGLEKGNRDNILAEYRFLSGDGSYRTVFSRGKIERDKEDGLLFISAMMDVTESRKLQEAILNQKIDHQKELMGATMLGQEKEKVQIGKELHDNVNQILASVKLYLDIAISNKDMKDELLLKCRENTLYAIDEVRKLSHSLMPPSLDSSGLVEAIKDLVEEMNIIGLFKTEFSIDGFDENALDDNKKLMLYRIVQEQTNNIIKHSKAEQVSIALKRQNGHLLFIIADDGVGFDTTQKSKGIGLKNIDSRISYFSGNVQLISAPGMGTSLEVLLPI